MWYIKGICMYAYILYSCDYMCSLLLTLTFKQLEFRILAHPLCKARFCNCITHLMDHRVVA